MSRIREPFRDLRACPFCGSLLERVGKWDIDPRDDTVRFDAIPIEEPCRPDAPGSEVRYKPTRDKTDARGNTRQVGGEQYHVRPRSYLCTRHMTAEDPTPECGMILDVMAKRWEGEEADLPDWAVYGETAQPDVGAWVRAKLEEGRML